MCNEPSTLLTVWPVGYTYSWVVLVLARWAAGTPHPTFKTQQCFLLGGGRGWAHLVQRVNRPVCDCWIPLPGGLVENRWGHLGLIRGRRMQLPRQPLTNGISLLPNGYSADLVSSRLDASCVQDPVGLLALEHYKCKIVMKSPLFRICC